MPKNIVIFSNGTAKDGGARPLQRVSNIYKMYWSRVIIRRTRFCHQNRWHFTTQDSGPTSAPRPSAPRFASFRSCWVRSKARASSATSIVEQF